MPELLSLIKTNCRDCHKCIRFCPVKAIKYTGQQAHIIDSQCILCGQCYVVCPHDAKEIADDRPLVESFLKNGQRTVAAVDPSFVAAFDGSGFKAFRTALKEFGFADAVECGIGATLVKQEYEKLLREGSRSIILTSACPSINSMIEKYYPDVRQYLAPVISPMVATAKLIKREAPDTRVVYIGPCIARKAEATGTEVDAVLTYTQLDEMLTSAGYTIDRRMDADPKTRERTFALCGGIISTLDVPESDYTFLALDGIHLCKSVLADISQGHLGKCFIELSACRGSCVGGPDLRKHDNHPVQNYMAVKEYAGPEDYEVEPLDSDAMIHSFVSRQVTLKMPTEAEISQILHSMGKMTRADELDCGTCGYDTCRDKAIAVYRGLADPSMCLPYIMEKSERISSSIIDNSPNGLLLLNDDFEIQTINKAAMEFMNVKHQSDVLGENIIRLLDPTPFFQVYESGKKIVNRRIYVSDYKKYFDQTIIRDHTTHTIICILRDVTDEETQRQEKEQLGRTTAEIADRVVDKQMRIVQEIASLLGETTAETKVALTKLKESIENEDTAE